MLSNIKNTILYNFSFIIVAGIKKPLNKSLNNNDGQYNCLIGNTN